MFFNDSQLAEIRNLILHSNTITVVTHKSPDGDALGSSLGLKHAFMLLFSKQISVIVPDAFPESLAYLPSSDSILVFDVMKERTTEVLHATDLLFCLDG